MAWVGQLQMHAMQWVHFFPHTGFPFSMRMLPRGQRAAHFPQEMQALDTVNGSAFTLKR